MLHILTALVFVVRGLFHNDSLHDSKLSICPGLQDYNANLAACSDFKLFCPLHVCLF